MLLEPSLLYLILGTRHATKASKSTRSSSVWVPSSYLNTSRDVSFNIDHDADIVSTLASAARRVIILLWREAYKYIMQNTVRRLSWGSITGKDGAVTKGQCTSVRCDKKTPLVCILTAVTVYYDCLETAANRMQRIDVGCLWAAVLT